MFNAYLQLGFHHIANFNAYDHMVFVLAMSAGYTFSDWKKLAILVTAFTLGHSLTLAFATLGILSVDSALVEFLIPVTIFLTSLYVLLVKRNRGEKLVYVAVLFFGLIHGLGFSNFLRQTLSSEESLFEPLFAFNIGLEIGQLLILATFLLVSLLVTRLFKFPAKDWHNYICGIASGISIVLMINTKFW